MLFNFKRCLVIIFLLLFYVSNVFCIEKKPFDRHAFYQEYANLYYGDKKELYRKKINGLYIPGFSGMECTDEVVRLAYQRGRSTRYLKHWSKSKDEARAELCIATVKAHDFAVNNIINWQNRRLITCSVDKTLKAWDFINIQNIKCTDIFKGHESCVNTLAYLSNEMMVSGSCDNSVKIWRVIKSPLSIIDYFVMLFYYPKQFLTSLNEHSKRVNSVCTLSDGLVASGSEDTTLKIWDWKQTQCVDTFKGHLESVNAVLELRDGHLVSCSNDKTVKIWKRTHYKKDLSANHFICDPCVATLERHTAPVNCVIEHTDGYLVSCSSDNTLIVWDRKQPKDSQCIRVLKGHSGPVLWVVELLDGRLVSCSKDKTLKIWGLNEPLGKECLATLEGHSESVNAVTQITFDQIVSCSDDGTLKVWDLNDSRIDYYSMMPLGVKLKIAEKLNGNDCRSLVSISNYSKVMTEVLLSRYAYSLYGKNKKACRNRITNMKIPDVPSEKFTLKVGEDNCNKLAFHRLNSNKQIRNGMEDNKLCTNIINNEEPIFCIDRLADDYLLVVYRSCKATVWDLTNPNEPRCTSKIAMDQSCVRTYDYCLNSVHKLSDNLILFTFCRPIIEVWDFSNPAMPFKANCVNLDYSVKKVIQLTNGYVVGFGSDSEMIQVWDLKEKDKNKFIIAKFGQDFRLGIRSLLELPCNLLASIYDRADIYDDPAELYEKAEAITVWNCKKSMGSERFRTLIGHKEPVNDIILHTDGFIISTSSDKTLKVWGANFNADTTCLQTLEGHAFDVCTVKQLENGNLVSIDKEGYVMIWKWCLGLATVCIHTLEGLKHYQGITLIDGSLLFLSVDLSTIEIIDFNECDKGVSVATLQSKSLNKIKLVSQLADGRIVTLHRDGKIGVWDPYMLPENQCVKVMTDLTYHDIKLEYSNDYRHLEVIELSYNKLISVSFDYKVIIWGLR